MIERELLSLADGPLQAILELGAFPVDCPLLPTKLQSASLCVITTSPTCEASVSR
jgi:hypothetical protein